MRAPATIRARGIVRRASLISSPMNEAASEPLKAYRMVAQTPSVVKLNEGVKLGAVKDVEEPNFAHAIIVTTHNRLTGIQTPSAPRLLSHLPIFRPTMLRASASPTPKNEKAMKYHGLRCKAVQRVPPM